MMRLVGLAQWLSVVFVGAAIMTTIAIEVAERAGAIAWSDLTPDQRLRRAWVVAAGPWVAGIAAVIVTLLPGMLDELGVIVGHCHIPGAHGIYHICWHNPPPATDSLWVNSAWIALAGVAGFALARGLWDVWRARRLLAELESAPWQGLPQPAIREIETDRAIAATVGWWSPVTLVSSGLRDALSDQEWRAVLAHERAHATRRDGLWAGVLDVLGAVLLPAASRRVREQHRLGVEQVCDRAAAEQVDVFSAADALVSVARRQGEARPATEPRVPSTAEFSFGAENLTRRIEALVGEQSEPTCRIHATAFLGGALAASLLTSPWLHRGIDTLMNHFL